MNDTTTTEVLNNTFIEEKQSFIKRLFGCWHQRLSKPVTIDKTTFCYCKDCGLRRKFDIETFKPQGAFYSPRPVKTIYFV
ncbi:MAG: hypothetical protein ABJA66_01135 [Actinomycetota bacterium]